jgi:lysophospholipase L1-like esterase
MRLRPVAIIAAAIGLLISTTSVSASSEKFNPPKQSYLALGDSLAYGFQQARFNAEFPQIVASTFRTGYVDDFAADLRAVRPNIQTVNLGCPGETTASYFTHCAFSALGPLSMHVVYNGSQSAAALAFLRAHPGTVSPITLDDGANDITACLTSTDPNCIPNALVQVGANLDRALGELRAAAPDAEIIVMQYYDPYGVQFPTTVPVLQALNATIASAASAHRARLADALTPFNLAPGALCGLGPFCPAVTDVHPNDAGYAVIAQRFWAASGYSRLGH